MANFSQLALQKAIYSALEGDSSLASLITGIFDHTPQNTAFPYVMLGIDQSRDWSTKTSSGMEHAPIIQVWSREGGRQEAYIIMERIYTLLHTVDLSVEGQSLVFIRCVASAISLEADGMTYHGSMQFRALLESIA